MIDVDKSNFDTDPVLEKQNRIKVRTEFEKYGLFFQFPPPPKNGDFG